LRIAAIRPGPLEESGQTNPSGCLPKSATHPCDALLPPDPSEDQRQVSEWNSRPGWLRSGNGSAVAVARTSL